MALPKPPSTRSPELNRCGSWRAAPCFALKAGSLSRKPSAEKLRRSGGNDWPDSSARDDLTISVEVVNVADGTQLWGQQYKRYVAQLANVQQEIAGDIKAGLRPKLTGAPNQLNRGGSLDSDAYQAYLRGRYYLNKRSREGIQKAIQQFQEAINHDQNYAAAYTGLADSYSFKAILRRESHHDGRPILRSNS